MFGGDPEASAAACHACHATAAEWLARPFGKRFAIQEGWCWRAAEARHNGLPAPEDPRECLAPCPRVSRRAEEILDLIRLAGRQMRVSFGGPIGLDWNVLARLADDAGITTDMEWYELLSAAEGVLIEAISPKKDEE